MHSTLTPAMQAECQRLVPADVQSQTAFLFVQWQGNLPALAAWTRVSPRVIRRAMNGSRLRFSPRARGRLASAAVEFACPVQAASRAEERRREAERDARRAKRRQGQEEA
jgi:hypothetical protein